jgi:hypothetical protein
MNSLNLTAIIIALNEEVFIKKCIDAIYNYVQRIFVITNYDHDYSLNYLEPDETLNIIANYSDIDNKIILLLNRKILDETIQRNWAIATDKALYNISNRRIFPHAHSVERIRKETSKTDYFWIIDADEIYDPETIPTALEFLMKTNYNAVLVRGYNFFKTWNYKLDEYFCHIGFLRPDRYFYSRRSLYFPKPLGWLHHFSPELSRRLINLYCRQTILPESIAVFYHGAYVGDDERIKKKISISSHFRELKKANIDQWFENTWKNWHPGMENFRFGASPEAWQDVEQIPTGKLPKIIRGNTWPEGWINE